MTRRIAPIACTWMDTELLVTRLSDQFGRAWVSHQFPGRDGVAFEDMGAEPARLTIEAVLYGPTWFTQLEALRDQVELLYTEEGRLVHPYWGVLYGFMTSLTVTHEDSKLDFALVQLQFVEARLLVDDAQSTSAAIRAASEQARSVLATAAVALAALEDGT